MINAFYSGSAGLKAQQTAMDDISNNIANINTTGFKSTSTQFSDLLYTSMLKPGEPGYSQTLSGNGIAVSAIEMDMSSGGAQATGNMLDYSVNDSGFFAVKDNGGNTYYTQDGSFSVKPGPNGGFLVNSEGFQVLDAQGNPINVGDDGNPQTAPGVFKFSNSQELLSAGDNLFNPSALSGVASISDEGFKSGFLEGSNVDLSQQMERMIVTQRGYQMSSRVVQTADQIESMAMDLKS